MEMMRIESKPKWVWIMVLTTLLWFTIRSNACWGDERIALLRLKPFFHHYLKDWVEVKGSNCCEWERVECNSTTRRVISLDLNYTRNYNWRLSDGFYVNVSLFLPFVELKTLYLKENGIAGFVGIHEGFAKLPSTLEILDLSDNYYLNDSILSSLSQLSSLKHLGLSDNQFTGSSNGFKQLSRLGNLETLDLGGNSLNNSILSQLGNLSCLRTLNLRDNNFEGTLHIQELNNLTNLKTLDLSWNRIESLQSKHQGNGTQLRLTNLEELRLSGNLFRNNTFAFLLGLSRLKSLDMRQNQLCGSIDIKGLNNLINLKKLDLSINKIESLRSFQDNGRQLKLTHLEELHLGDNLFNNNFGTFTNLEELDMSYNNGLDEFVADKGSKSLRKLKVLRLDGVIANGSLTTLQEIIESFSYVKTFYLRWNYFNRTDEGTQELNVSSHVEQLILDHSYLNTNILQRIGVFTSLKTLSLFYSGLTGPLPDQGWCDLRKLEEFYIDGNALEGKLPSCLGNLTSLRVLDISSNKFTGNLTPFANLRPLRFLSLSQNHFQVSPSFLSLSNLTHLKILLSDENQLVMESVFYTSVPKFQLKIISLVKCTTDPKLTQELSKFLYYQHDLRHVDLSYNNFNGTIPFWLLENNTKLETLLLKGDSLTGPLLLPPLRNLNLSVIDISNNNLRGQIPRDICSIFPHLEWLFLSKNAFKGNIPPCLGGMSYLSILDLSSNQLSGEVWKELTMNSSWEILRLSNNNLGGNIVPTIFKSDSLRALYLDGNNFVGELPKLDIQSTDIPSWSLNDIDLSNNSLSGKIPRWIWNLPYLSGLALSNNHFEGTISMDLCNSNELDFLDLAQNNLSGSLPSCFNPPVVRHVHLSRNKLNGSLKHGFFNSSFLVTLDLSETNLTGNIPEWIGTLSALSVLLLKENKLDGEIPVQLCKLYSLSIIDLSHNMFSGTIPSCLGNLTVGFEYYNYKSYINTGSYSTPLEKEVSEYTGMDRTNIDDEIPVDYPWSYMEERVEFSTKSGSYLYGGRILDYMSGIDLSCNNLTGHIPLELGNLSEIHALNLSHNNLTGVIPFSFSNLKQIESMDLSYNSLTGEIPKQLVELNSLEVFSVAHNNLWGTTPEPKAQFGTFNESSYKGNPLLCGPPLRNSCSKTDSPPTVSSTTSNEGERGSLLDTYVFCVSFLVTYGVVLLVIFAVLYINPYWRQLWFLFIEDCIDTCRYSFLGNFVELYIFKRCD